MAEHLSHAMQASPIAAGDNMQQTTSVRLKTVTDALTMLKGRLPAYTENEHVQMALPWRQSS